MKRVCSLPPAGRLELATIPGTPLAAGAVNLPVNLSGLTGPLWQLLGAYRSTVRAPPPRARVTDYRAPRLASFSTTAPGDRHDWSGDLVCVWMASEVRLVVRRAADKGLCRS